VDNVFETTTLICGGFDGTNYRVLLWLHRRRWTYTPVVSMATGTGGIICKCYWIKAITCAGHGNKLDREDLFNFRLVNVVLNLL
jgi:hypothetical protein